MEGGALKRIWAILIEECEELGGVNWEWQSADCSMGKAHLGGIGRNPTDRSKAGSKESVLVDAEGGPLSVVVPGANVDDTKLLSPTLESIVVNRPEEAQNLCLDKAYDSPTGHGAVAGFRCRLHIRRIGEEKLDDSDQNATRPGGGSWNAERTLAWLSKCRTILVRYDKKPVNYVGPLQLASALIWHRRQ